MGSFYQADKLVHFYWDVFCICDQRDCKLVELLAYEVLSHIMGDIIRGLYIGIYLTIMECVLGMLYADVT
jgi:hypothetical protein